MRGKSLYPPAMFSPHSSSGRRARAPLWWSSLVSKVPSLRLPWLKPKTWTPELAQRWVDHVPPRCPFERQLWLGDLLLLYIPPLCPLNPFSPQLYEIRLEAQQFLLDRAIFSP